MRRVLLVAAGISLLATACGTTVPLTSQQAAGAGAGSTAELGGTGHGRWCTTAPGGEGGGVGRGSATGAIGGGGGGIAGGVAVAQVPRSTGSTGSTGGTAGPTAAGGNTTVGKATPVKIGFTTVPDAAAFFAASAGRARTSTRRDVPHGRCLGQRERRTQRPQARRQDRGGLGDESGVLRLAVSAAVPEVHAGRQGRRRQQHRRRREHRTWTPA